MEDLTEDFVALDYHDFASLYLEAEGVLSKRASELNKQNTDDANKWAAEIFNDIRRWFERQVKSIADKGGRSDSYKEHNSRSSDHKVYGFGNYQIQLKIYRIGSFSNQEVPIVDVIITPRQRIEINIYDSESVMVKFTPVLARKLDEKPMSVVKRSGVARLVTKALRAVL